MSVRVRLVSSGEATTTWEEIAEHVRDKRNQAELAFVVKTRMKNRQVLNLALVATGADVTDEAETIHASWRAGVAEEVAMDLTQDDDGVWKAHIVGELLSNDKIENLLSKIDHAYGLEVQRTVVERLRNNATGAGMTLESETDEDDGSITVVLQVNA